MLKIQTYLKQHGLEKTINDFDLIYKEYDNRFLLKYKQIDSDFSKQEVRECRGLILEKNTYNVISLGFKKFFNHGEQWASKIDWDSAEILEKIDGSYIQVYNYNNKWYMGTSGTGEGEGEVNNKPGLTFNNLFNKILKEKYNLTLNSFNPQYIYIFELTTPYNIVVTPHKESKITLLTLRDLHNLKELSREDVLKTGQLYSLPVVKSFNFKDKNIQTLIDTFENMPYYEEGYVIVDKYFNRIKIKNPKYLAVHYLKSSTAQHHILIIIKSNEIEEYVSTIPERKDELLNLKEKYDLLLKRLNNIWDNLL